MNQTLIKFNLIAFLSLLLVSCSQSNANDSNPDTSVDNQNQSTLKLVANGEDFVRQGFVSKDGWKISFDRVDVNLSDVTAYQINPPFEPTETTNIDSLQSQEKISLVDTETIVDLAQGSAEAEPIIVTNIEVPPGFYNALAWKIDTAAENTPLAGKTMVLQGQASKDNQVINFDISFNRPIQYLCGEYIGDERKGIVTAEKGSEIEMTLHFDHLFGDSQTSADEALNVDALGFQPLADLAAGDRLIIDDATLAQKLSSSNQEKLTNALVGLGHVGEGHCAIIKQQ